MITQQLQTPKFDSAGARLGTLDVGVKQKPKKHIVKPKEVE